MRHLAMRPTWGQSGKYNILLITTNNTICQAQISPFYFYQKKLLEKFSIRFTEIDINRFRANDYKTKIQPDAIFYQPWFNEPAANISQDLKGIKSKFPQAKLCFLDSFAPIDLRFAELVDPYIDFYIKKQSFRDATQFAKKTAGDTNLTDYFSDLYGLNLPQTSRTIPAGFMNKLVVGPGFFTSNQMLPFLSENESFPPRDRDIDLHARLGGSGGDWYGRMRAHSISAVLDIKSEHKVIDANVKHKEYMNEMQRSKICFSPFGFGEVCWRDYEAVITGALLIKPDMQHVLTEPNIFVENKSYVSVKWDLSDLGEKVDYYLKQPQERARITKNAYQVLRDYVISDSFPNLIVKILGSDSVASKSA